MKRLVFALLVLLSGLSQFAAAEAPPLTVGMVLSLTGAAADYGQAVRAGIELAAADHPDEARRVHFIYEDAGYDTSRAVSAFQKLVTVDGVQLVYVWGVTFCQSLAPLAEARGVPLVAECVADNVSRGQNHVVRFMNYTDQYMRRQLADLAARGKMKIGIIAADNAYIQSLFAALERNLLPGQSVVLVDHQAPAEMDFRTFIRKVKSADVDTLGVFLLMGQVSAFYRQLREQQYQGDTFGTNVFESKTEIDASGGAMDEARFVNNFVSPAFESRLEAKLGRVTQQGFAAVAYEFASLLFELVGANDIRSGEDLLRAMKATTPRLGKVTGDFRYVEDNSGGHYFEFPLSVKWIKDGRVEQVSVSD